MSSAELHVFGNAADIVSRIVEFEPAREAYLDLSLDCREGPFFHERFNRDALGVVMGQLLLRKGFIFLSHDRDMLVVPQGGYEAKDSSLLTTERSIARGIEGGGRYAVDGVGIDIDHDLHLRLLPLEG